MEDFKDEILEFIVFEQSDDARRIVDRNMILFNPYHKLPDQYYWTSEKAREVANYLLKFADWKDEI